VRDSLVIAGIALTIVTLVFSTLFVGGMGYIAPGRASLPAIAPSAVGSTPPPSTVSSTSLASTAAAIPASTASTPPTTIVAAYPTKVSQLLSSAAVVTRQTTNAVAKGLAFNGGPGIGHAYGVVKQTVSVTSVVIEDQVTIMGVNGTIPGHMDMIQVQAHYNGDTTPYCTKSTIFDATGLASYSTSFQCSYLGAGTYNFKVMVYDDNGTVIGDPTFSLVL
jgi:hypothetical protein